MQPVHTPDGWCTRTLDSAGTASCACFLAPCAGTATANVIRTLHGIADPVLLQDRMAALDRQASQQEHGLLHQPSGLPRVSPDCVEGDTPAGVSG